MVSSVKMEVSRTLLSVLTALCVTIVFTEAHVALTFPPARKYDLDFLDNSRTKGPCGMPKGKNSFVEEGFPLPFPIHKTVLGLQRIMYKVLLLDLIIINTV